MKGRINDMGKGHVKGGKGVDACEKGRGGATAYTASAGEIGSTHVKRCVILTRVEATSKSTIEPSGASTTPTLMASHTFRMGGEG